MLNKTGLDHARVGIHSARITATHDLVKDGAYDIAIVRDARWIAPRLVGMHSRGAKARRGAMVGCLKRLAIWLPT